MYETERLVQELALAEVDIRNIVVNQILLPGIKLNKLDDDCFKCNSRFRMQKKYLNQILELYYDFNVTLSPLQNEEVKGIDGLKAYAARLLQKVELPEIRIK